MAPYVDHADVNGGGPHSAPNAVADVDGGKMDGFIGQAQSGRKGCLDPDRSGAAPTRPRLTSWATTRSDIPNYWAYAKDFVLQDHMFEPNASWSLPSHLFLVSEWSAYCTQEDNRRVRQPMQTAAERPANAPAVYGGQAGPKKRHRVNTASSRAGSQPDLCVDRPDLPAAQGPRQLGLLRGRAERSRTARTTPPMTCAPVAQNANTPGSGTRCPSSTRCGRTTSWGTSRP